MGTGQRVLDDGVARGNTQRATVAGRQVARVTMVFSGECVVSTLYRPAHCTLVCRHPSNASKASQSRTQQHGQEAIVMALRCIATLAKQHVAACRATSLYTVPRRWSTTTVAVALSGGVDSSVAALLMKQQVRPPQPSPRQPTTLTCLRLPPGLQCHWSVHEDMGQRG